MTHLQQRQTTATLLRHIDERLNTRNVVVHNGPVHRGRSGLVRLLQKLSRGDLKEGVEDICDVSYRTGISELVAAALSAVPLLTYPSVGYRQ